MSLLDTHSMLVPLLKKWYWVLIFCAQVICTRNHFLPSQHQGSTPLHRMSDARALLKQARQTRRITHPYAKYNSQGALYCTACAQKIPSEALWESHISSVSHKERVKEVIREGQTKAKRSIAATAFDEESEEKEPESRKRVRIAEEAPAVVEGEPDAPVEPEETTTQAEAQEGLPEDFFDAGNQPKKVGVDEDEWKKFQEEISQTIRTQEDGDQEEQEDISRTIVEEFDELNTLEDRLVRLRKRRAELQEAVKDKPVVMTEDNMDEGDDADEEEEEWW